MTRRPETTEKLPSEIRWRWLDPGPFCSVNLTGVKNPFQVMGGLFRGVGFVEIKLKNYTGQHGASVETKQEN